MPLILLAADDTSAPPPIASWKGTGLSPGPLTSTTAGPGDNPFTSLGNTASLSVVSSGPSPARVQMAAGVANVYAGWGSTVLGTLTSYRITGLLELSALGSFSHAILAGQTGATSQWRLDLGGSAAVPPGQLRLRNNAAQVAASTQGLAAGVLYRVVVEGQGSTIAVAVYNATTGALAAGPITGTASAASIDNVRFGNYSSSTTGPVQLWDDMAVAPLTVTTVPAGHRSTLWSAGGMVTATSEPTVWNVHEVVSPATASTSWAVATSVATSRATSWAVEGTVTATRVTTWDVAQPPAVLLDVEADRATSWAVFRLPIIPPLPAVEPVEARQFLVVVRDNNLQRVGAVPVTALTFTSRYCDLGEWSLSVDATAPAAELLMAPGAGVMVYHPDRMETPLLTGPVRQRSRKLTEDGYILECSGPDDMIWLADRLVYQMPARTAPNQGTPSTGAVSHDRRTGAAETVIKGYVDSNVGQAALVDRRALSVVASLGRGSTVSGVARMQPTLLELIRPLAATGGIGFRVYQDGTTLRFDVFVPTNRTGTVRFSRLLGNLQSFELTETAPTASYVVAGGQGEMTARVFRDSLDADALVAWPKTRVERFIDQRQAETTAELDQALAEELVSGGPTTSLALTTRDIPQIRFGDHYFVGDRVTVEPQEGVLLQDVLREVTCSWSADEGPSVITRVGSHETTGTPRLLRLVRRLQAKQQGSTNTVE